MNASLCVPRGCGKILIGVAVACWLIAAGTAEAQWTENFDSYANGSQVIGQGGWQGWDADTTVGALAVNTQAFSPPNSVRIYGTALTSGNYSDLVHKFSGYTSGKWIFSARQYVPAAATGTSWFILMARYSDGGAKNWGVQTQFDLGATNTVTEYGYTTAAFPIIRDRWVDLRYLIDLTANTVSIYYNGNLLSTHVWSTGANALQQIQAIDLYSDISGPVYYDNLSLKPATVVVNTADNTDFSAGKTNLYYAITNCESAGTIAFNIPGAGPHFLQVPSGGLPLIYQKHNLTIDGYTQPGAVPNNNPITAANNAVLKIVIDGRNGNGRNMDASTYNGTLAASDPPINNTAMANERTGYGTTEWALLGIYRSRNVTVKGLAFLADDLTTYAVNSVYCIAFEHDYGLNTAVMDPLAYDDGSDRNGHVAGCWFGVNPTNQTSAGVVKAAAGIAFFRHRDVSGGTRPDLPNEGLMVGVAPGSANPRAEFNVFTGAGYMLAGEAVRTRVSGNFFGVMPDGVTPYDLSLIDPTFFSDVGCLFEIGRYSDTQPIIIGTDGDGVNDADEGNLLGPVGDGLGNTAISLYGTSDKLYVIAGNTFGAGVDGRRWTNSAYFVSSLGINGGTHVQIGSDFDGVSDTVEANRVYNNWPVPPYPNPAANIFAVAKMDSPPNPGAAAWISMRGNKLVNNNLTPFRWADGSGMQLPLFTAYSNPYMDTTTQTVPLPTLASNSVYPKLKGTFPVGKDPYTNIIVDVYQLDPEGWASGKAIAGAQGWFSEQFTDYATYTNGFPQGAKYVGSFPVANTGSFDVDVSGKDLGSGFVTATVNYSADKAGTRRGRTHTGNFANPVVILPNGAASVGLTQTVPDVLLWYSTAGNYPTNGPVVLGTQNQNLGNWEPYVSVLGDSTFLIENNTFASDGASQNFTVALQPAAGGAAKLAYAFYADDRTPFKDPVNLSRQNGNPGRVAGDPRYGAVNYMTEAEASLGQIPAFQTVARWANNPIYTGTARYACAQPFSLNPLTLVPTPLTNAWDFVYGSFVTATAPASTPEVSRTGGKPIGLDNGNFVVMNHDKTRYLFPDGDAATFSIVTPSGSIVKSATLAKGQDIWDNMCAYRGGFAIRVHNSLLFYNNAGTLMYSNDVNVSSGVQYWGGSTDADGRGDALRIASDIRSHYVFFAARVGGANQNANPVHVGAWDARTGNFVAETVVSDVDPTLVKNDRVTVAVDQYNRICVAWAVQPLQLNFPKRQIVARVLAFDGASFSYLTYPFYPFVNHDLDGTLLMEGFAPSVAMTPRQICIAARGQVNSTNNPTGGADIMMDTDYYTVISHPAPVAPVSPRMTVTRSGAIGTISWPADAGLFVLQATPTLSPAAWTDVTPQPPIVRVGSGDANDQYQMTVPVGSGTVFARLVRRW